MQLPRSIPGVVDVLHLRGAQAHPDAPPTLLVEVPHGADRTAHYDALLEQLSASYPADLADFFHVNTDVGAWAYGLRVAERILEAHPHHSALLLRSLIPRTFIDCNRVIQASGGDLDAGELTAALPPYVRDPADQARLLELYRQYVSVADAAFDWVCGAGGLALLPHTYGPVTLGIARVDDRIVQALHEAHRPEVYATWPVRDEIDLITTTPGGEDLSPPGLCDALIQAFAEHQLTAVRNGAYNLHPSALGSTRAAQWPAQTLCVEVRRDLLVSEWTPFAQMEPVVERVERVAEPLARVLAAALPAHPLRATLPLR